MTPCKSTAEEVPSEWSQHGISFTDSKVRATLHVSIIDSYWERKGLLAIPHSNEFLSFVVLFTGVRY